MTDAVHVLSKKREDTIELARLFSGTLKQGDCIALDGDLGSGKTVFVKGLASGLGMKKTHYVNSPTFVIMHKYPTRPPLFHFDAYRIEEIDEMYELGYREYFYGKGVTAIEWARTIQPLLPDNRFSVTMKITSSGNRSITIRGRGGRCKKQLDSFKKKHKKNKNV